MNNLHLREHLWPSDRQAQDRLTLLKVRGYVPTLPDDAARHMARMISSGRLTFASFLGNAARLGWDIEIPFPPALCFDVDPSKPWREETPPLVRPYFVVADAPYPPL